VIIKKTGLECASTLIQNFEGGCFFFTFTVSNISELPIWLNLNNITKQTILNSKLNYTGLRYGKTEAYCVQWVRARYLPVLKQRNFVDSYYRYEMGKIFDLGALITGVIWVLKSLESPRIQLSPFPGLESQGKGCWSWKGLEISLTQVKQYEMYSMADSKENCH